MQRIDAGTRAEPCRVAAPDGPLPDRQGDRAGRLATALLLAYLAGQITLSSLAAFSLQQDTSRALITTGVRVLIAGLQLVHSLPRLRPTRERYWKATFTAQALLSFVPYFFLGLSAIGGGDLAGSALLLFRRSAGWTWFGLILAAEAAILATTGVAPGTIVSLVVDGSLVFALATYGLTRLTEVITELRATRDAVVQATAREARLRAARDVFGTLGGRLATLASFAEQAGPRMVAEPENAGQMLAELGAGARQVLAQARATSSAFRAADDAGTLATPDAFQVRRSEPRLAFAIVIVMSVPGAIANLTAIVGTHSSWSAGALAGLTALVGLQIYHGAPRSGGALPRGRRWTLTAQLLLVYLPIPLFGMNWAGMTCYLAACTLVALRPPASRVLFAAVAASLPFIVIALKQPPLACVAFVLNTFWDVLIFYGPMRLARLTLDLRSARAELTRVMLVQARLEVARDVHDVLSASLAAAALKADLARRLLPRDAARAGAELADVTTLAQRALAEARALSGTEPDTTLAGEIASARSVLAAAGVGTQVSAGAVPGALPAAVDRALAVVVREGVTNVLRHSSARHCMITARIDDGVLRLEVSNDGVTAPTGDVAGGSGISNLGARLQAVAGTLTAGQDGGGRFMLAAEVPVMPQSEPGPESPADVPVFRLAGPVSGAG
jgi:signal transduction histidine kinase